MPNEPRSKKENTAKKQQEKRFKKKQKRDAAKRKAEETAKNKAKWRMLKQLNEFAEQGKVETTEFSNENLLLEQARRDRREKANEMAALEAEIEEMKKQPDDDDDDDDKDDHEKKKKGERASVRENANSNAKTRIKSQRNDLLNFAKSLENVNVTLKPTVLVWTMASFNAKIVWVNTRMKLPSPLTYKKNAKRKSPRCWLPWKLRRDNKSKSGKSVIGRKR